MKRYKLNMRPDGIPLEEYLNQRIHEIKESIEIFEKNLSKEPAKKVTIRKDFLGIMLEDYCLKEIMSILI